MINKTASPRNVRVFYYTLIFLDLYFFLVSALTDFFGTYCITRGEPPEIETIDDKGYEKTMKTSKEALLLGGTFHHSSFWKAHIESGEEALLPKIRKKLRMLKHVGKT